MTELQKDSEEFEIHQVCWKYYKKYYTPQDTDEYWESVIEEGNEIIKRYKKRTLVRGIINTYMKDINERYDTYLKTKGSKIKHEEENNNNNPNRISNISPGNGNMDSKQG